MTDVFRKEYVNLSDEVKAKIASIKDKAQWLYDEIEADITGSDQRMRALAKTNLEQAVMWAIKAIT